LSSICRARNRIPETGSAANAVSVQNVAFAGIMYQTVHEGLAPCRGMCVWNGQRWRKNGKRMPHYSLNARMGLEALASISTIFLLHDFTFDPSSVYFNYIFSFHVICSSFLFMPLCFL